MWSIYKNLYMYNLYTTIAAFLGKMPFFSTERKNNNDYDCIAYWVDVIYTLKMPILCNKTDIPNLQPPWTINWIIFFCLLCFIGKWFKMFKNMRVDLLLPFVFLFLFNFITTKWYIMYNWYMSLIRVLSVTRLFSK